MSIATKFDIEMFDVFKIKLELLYRWEVNRILTIKLQW